MMVCAPAASAEVVKVEEALLPLPVRALPAPRSVVPSKKSTPPVGVALPVVSVTVAVKVTELAATDGLALEATAVDVALLTVWVRVALLSVKNPPWV